MIRSWPLFWWDQVESMEFSIFIDKFEVGARIVRSSLVALDSLAYPRFFSDWPGAASLT